MNDIVSNTTVHMDFLTLLGLFRKLLPANVGQVMLLNSERCLDIGD